MVEQKVSSSVVARDQPTQGRLLAGIGRETITPPADIPNGMWMAQTHVRARGVHQELWLTALALRDGDETVLVIDLDWCLLSDAQVTALRSAVTDATGVPALRILPCCTHNHAGPVTQDGYRGEGADMVARYVAALPGWAQAACLAALADLQPVRVAAGTGRSEIGINRDLVLEDGRAVAGPNPDGFADRSVGVVRLERDDGSPLAILVNYACHPTVLGPDNVLVSPDYPGTTKRVVEGATGATCLFLQGAAGDMGPVEGFVGDPRVAERLGTLLGLEAAKVALSLDARPLRRRLARVVASGAPLTVYQEERTGAPAPRLRVRSRRVGLPIRTPLPEVLSGAPARLDAWSEKLAARRSAGAAASEIAEAHQNVERERLRAERYLAFAHAGEVSVEMHALALGSIALLLTWGEPYSRIGAEVKEGSRFDHTFFCGYLGGDPMYVVTPEAFEEPQPFQVDNCPFAPSAASQLVRSALALLDELSQP
jgi:hypothetical protein